MIKRSRKFIRDARGTTTLSAPDAKIVKSYMPYDRLRRFTEMSRVKGGTVTHARHKKIIKAAKGLFWPPEKCL